MASMWAATGLSIAPIVTTDMWLSPPSRHAAISPGHWLSPRLYCWMDSKPNASASLPSSSSLATILALDLDRLGLSPARKKESVPDPGRPVERGLAETSQPDRDLPFRARQYSGSVDPVVGVFMVDHRLLPQLTEQGDLMLLPPAAAAKMSGHFEAVVFHPVPTDPDTQAK